jgi:hypothetical protein
MVKVPSPHYALNSHNVPGRRYVMDGSWLVPANTPLDDITDTIVRVADGRNTKLATVVINCHGVPGTLKIGQGCNLGDIEKFSNWKGKVERIWLIACRVSQGPDGYAFCRAMAVKSGAYVTGSVDLQYDDAWGVWGSSHLPSGYVDDWEGTVHRFDPDGTMYGGPNWKY